MYPLLLQKSAAALEGELHTHVDPCLQAFCSQCAVPDCPVRRQAQTVEGRITLDEAVAPGPF